MCLAALNNAAWCDAVCRAHGGSTSVTADCWRNEAPSPQFHPNLITLREDAQAAVEREIRGLDLRLDPGWGIKDSFADLELRTLGFGLLFEASWLWREAAAATPSAARAGDLHWAPAATSSELADWERAWKRSLGDTREARPDRPRFPPALLAREDIAFCAGHRDGAIVAGGVLSVGGDAIGISNVFAATADLAACWGGLVDEARRWQPGMAQCSYERAPGLAAALAQGFVVVGPLRVWLRSGEG
jgi:hypothetical protein